MRRENQMYRRELEQIRNKVASAETYLERVRRFDKKLRLITNLEDSERQVALGPIAPDESLGLTEDLAALGQSQAALSPDFIPSKSDDYHSYAAREKDLENLNTSLDRIELTAAEQESSMQGLENTLKDMGALLQATPAIWPSRGWVTSNFGFRLSPFSGQRQMHEGIDIAARPGTPVHSPADGIVTFVGSVGNFGKTVVLNHGYGTLTRYGHLSETFVRLGDSIRRGEKMGAIGNTGRSTGPHLHYEVIVNGIPRDPRKFILD
jgi:murein DD-endopeptidase MepM/ murein hydrolase activator NlpD